MDIYVVRGDAAQLARFHSEVGKTWRGGKFLERLSSNTEYRYWAFPTRTAPEARTFMFGSINLGLRLGFESYQEATYYPVERKQLDGIAKVCGARADSFFVQPDGALSLKPGQEEKFQVVDCLLTKVKKTSPVNEMPMGFVANAAPVEVPK